MHKLSSLEKAIQSIKSNWRRGMMVKEIAEQHGVDGGNLERAFRREHGMTIKQFIDDLRKEYVVSRLTGTDLLGYEIGAEIGFKSDLAFYRWVKRAFGVSFKELRSQVQRKRMTRKRNKK